MAPAFDRLSALVPSSGAVPGRAALTLPRPLPGGILYTGSPGGGFSLHGASQGPHATNHVLDVGRDGRCTHSSCLVVTIRHRHHDSSALCAMTPTWHVVL